MILKGGQDPEDRFRTRYDIDVPNAIAVQHFVIRSADPDNPFRPHKHEKEELWYMLEGEGIYSEDGNEHTVEAGDLIQIKPWALHGLSTESNIAWICLG
jgi:quercetin dioxygenase-like cupin family protein